MTPTILKTIRTQFDRDLQHSEMSQRRKEILAIYDKIVSDALIDTLETAQGPQRQRNEQKDWSYHPLVEKFWQEMYDPESPTDSREALLKFHTMSMQNVYQRFLAWWEEYADINAAPPSSKRFGGPDGLFLQVTGDLFTYHRTKHGRRLVLRDTSILGK